MFSFPLPVGSMNPVAEGGSSLPPPTASLFSARPLLGEEAAVDLLPPRIPALMTPTPSLPESPLSPLINLLLASSAVQGGDSGNANPPRGSPPVL